jgi:hypothetical protein
VLDDWGVEEFEITAYYERTILTPQLKESSPYVGRMTEMRGEPLGISASGPNLDDLIKYVLSVIYEIGEIDRVVMNDRFQDS